MSTAPPDEAERVAFTLRLDAALDTAVAGDLPELSRRLGVKVSRNDLVARALTFYLAQTREVRMSWRPETAHTPAANGNGANGKRAR